MIAEGGGDANAVPPLESPGTAVRGLQEFSAAAIASPTAVVVAEPP